MVKLTKKMRILLPAVAVAVIAAIVLSVVLIGGRKGTIYDYGEIKPVRTYMYEDTGWKPMEKEPNHIQTAMEIGSWSTDYATDIIGSYDLSNGTKWNPLANINFLGDPGGLYLLDGTYKVSEIDILFSKRGQYLDLYSSTDGKSYKKELSVTESNYKKFYAVNGDIYKFTAKDLNIAKTAFIKVVFTGSTEKSSRYINMHEISFVGEKIGDAPEKIPESNAYVKLPETLVAGAHVIGKWKRDRLDSASLGPKLTYDSNELTWWNPEAEAGYTGNPGIIYTLNAPTDIAQINLYFNDSISYFDLYVSRDDKNYEQIAMVRSNNASSGYSDRDFKNKVCALGPVNKKGIKYIKVIFKGRPGGNTFVNFCEIEILKTTKLKNGAWMMDVGGSADIYPVKHTVLGKWVNDRKTQSSLGPHLSYDFDETSRWNPEANVGYTGKPGIVYTLNKVTPIQKMSFDFEKNRHYFDVYVSNDDKNYTLVAAINSQNADKAYGSGYTATIDGLNLPSVKYVKLIFTGRENGNTYVNLVQVWFNDKGNPSADTSWLIPESRNSDVINIVSHEIIGSWKNDRAAGASFNPVLAYDKDPSSKWNPEANAGFTGDPGIVFKFDGSYLLQKLEITVGGNRHYFDVYVSKNGTNYTKIAAISYKNADTAYGSTNVALLDGLNFELIRYVKLVFKGRETADTFINFCEIAAYKKGLVGTDTSWMLPSEDDPTAAKITAHTVSGAWERSREGETSYNPALSYDANPGTRWNPQAKTNYAEDPGIIYTLSKAITLRKLTLTFSSAKHYFDVYVSSDNLNYKKIAKINASNADKAYSEYVATLDGLDVVSVKYVKLVFTGRETVNTYVNLHEVEVSETGTQGLDTSWMLPKESIAIKGNTLSGTWYDSKDGSQSLGPQLSYDSNVSTKWNPRANANYADTPGIIYNLKKFSSINSMQFNFAGRRYYFDVLASSDGISYNDVLSVNSTNADLFYDDSYTVSADGISITKVAFVKIVFTGCSEDNTYVNLCEVQFFGEEDGSDVTPEAAKITGSEIVGSWADKRASDASLGPDKAYDGNASSKWNPQVNTSFAGNPGIIFTLAKQAKVNGLELTFSSRKYYFDVYMSSNGTDYSLVKSVTSANSGEVYSNFVCSLDNLNYDNCTKIKIVFTGTSEASSTWINFHELVIN